MKSITVLFISVILIILMSFILNKQVYQISKGEQLVNNILIKSAKIIKEKYNIHPCGMGAAMPGGPIQGLTLCFETKYPYTKEQLRELLINAAEEFLNQVDKNDEIQQFLKERPFEIKNVEIIVYNHDKNGGRLKDPQISTSRISQGELTYRTVDPQDSFKFKSQYFETYEEALKKISKQEQNNSTTIDLQSRRETYSPSKGEQLVNQILSKSAKSIKSKYNINPCGSGAAMPGGPIRKLILCFNTKQSHTKEQLRELLIQVSQELLDQVIKNDEIQEFLHERPFTIRNIQIIIYNHDKEGRSLKDPNISNAQILKGILDYCTIDPEDSFRYKNEYEESYEEALKILSASKSSLVSSEDKPVEKKEDQESEANFRILKLLPNLLIPFAIEPGIPENFIAASPNGILDPYDWIYWGHKEVLEAYFKNPNSLKVPILRVKLSANVAQKARNSLRDEAFLKRVEEQDPEGFAFFETLWGDYPMLAIRTRVNAEGPLIFMAWVGLNDPEAGWTLMFNLVCPNKKGHPNRKDRQLWENLITKTVPLKGEDYVKFCRAIVP